MEKKGIGEIKKNKNILKSKKVSLIKKGVGKAGEIMAPGEIKRAERNIVKQKELVVRKLICEMEPEVFFRKCKEIADLWDERIVMVADFQKKAAEHKVRMKESIIVITKISKEIARRTQEKDVDYHWWHDYDSWEIKLLRDDTLDVVEAVVMDSHEQESLNL